jgi:hypothetical protein
MPMRLIYPGTAQPRELAPAAAGPEQEAEGRSGMFEVEVLGGDTPRICIRSTLFALDRDPKACANPDMLSTVSDDVGRRLVKAVHEALVRYVTAEGAG